MNSLDILSPRKIPSFLELKESSIPGAGLGIFATHLIKRDSYLGTYEGEYTEASAEGLVKQYPSSPYRWIIFAYSDAGYPEVPARIIGSVDAWNVKYANWTRYVNGTRIPQDANVVDKQYRGTVEYWSRRTIYPGEELFIYYGEEYNEHYKIK